MKVYLYVLDTLADWEIGFVTAELNSGRYFKDRNNPAAVIKVSHSLQPVKSMGGIEMTPDALIENVVFEKGDLLLLPGADTWQDAKHDKVLEIVDDLLNNYVTVAAICGATAALANKGILNSRRHTSNDKTYLEKVCPRYSGSHLYVNEPAVTDGNLITATGLAPLEFSYAILKKSGLLKETTLEAWYHLYKTRDAKYFWDLMHSLK